MLDVDDWYIHPHEVCSPARAWELLSAVAPAAGQQRRPGGPLQLGPALRLAGAGRGLLQSALLTGLRFTNAQLLRLCTLTKVRALSSRELLRTSVGVRLAVRGTLRVSARSVSEKPRPCSLEAAGAKQLCWDASSMRCWRAAMRRQPARHTPRPVPLGSLMWKLTMCSPRLVVRFLGIIHLAQPLPHPFSLQP